MVVGAGPGGQHRRAGARPRRAPGSRWSTRRPSPATRRAATWSGRGACGCWTELGVPCPTPARARTCWRSARPGTGPGCRPSPGAATRATGSWCRGWPSTTRCARPRCAAGASRSGPGSRAVEDGTARTGRSARSRQRRPAAGRRTVFIGADGALSPVARLAGMLDPDAALWGFAIRAYVPAEVPLPLLVLLDAGPVADLPRVRLAVPRRGRAGERGHRGRDGHPAPAAPAARRPGPVLRAAAPRAATSARAHSRAQVTGGWLRMGGTGTPPAAGNVLLVGDAAGLINPLQGEGIAPAMVSARLAAEAVLADPAGCGGRLHRGGGGTFGRYMPGRRGAAGGAAAPAAGGLGGRPAAHRARGAPAGARHLVAVLERPGGRRQPAPGRLGRRGGAAGGRGWAGAGPRPASWPRHPASPPRPCQAGRSGAGRSGAGRSGAGRSGAGRGRAGRTPAGRRRCRNSARAGDARRRGADWLVTRWPKGEWALATGVVRGGAADGGRRPPKRERQSRPSPAPQTAPSGTLLVIMA